MANLSDAYGTIIVERVGKEFIDYLRAVQGTDEQAYYKLIEIEDLNKAKPDKNGDLKIDFSTFGRWSYSSNYEGYLKGEWGNFTEDSKEKKAFNKFLNAMVKKNGVVDIDYTDSDPSMDWMGTGGFRMEVVDGQIAYSESFESQDMTISGYAELNNEDQYWALEYLKGDEVVAEYDKYSDKCKKAGKEPVEPENWYDNIYEDE